MTKPIDINSHRSAELRKRKRKTDEVRKMETRQRVRKALQEIAAGRSPTTTVVDQTYPKYWIVRTIYSQYESDENADWFEFKDKQSRNQFEAWLCRGGRSESLRVKLEFADSFKALAVRLVDAKTGCSCMGINFLAKIEHGRSNEIGLGRCFGLIDDALSRRPKDLLVYLKSRQAVDLDIASVESLLISAPTLVVMVDARVNRNY